MQVDTAQVRQSAVEHPEILRWNRIIAPECYIADEPQVYLLLLLDFIQPNKAICHICKTRILESLVKAASEDDVYWNTIPDTRIQGGILPTEKRLEARLAMMGINAANSWGLDMSYDDLYNFFEPITRKLTLNLPQWELLVSAAGLLCNRGSGRARTEQFRHKLEFMCAEKYTMEDMSNGRDLAEFIGRISRIVGSDTASRRHVPGEGECSCEIFSVLEGRHPDDISAIEWPAIVLTAIRPRVGPSILEIWSSSGFANPLGDEYKVPEDMDSNWVGDWQKEFDMVRITWPTRHAHLQVDMSPANARDYAIRMFLYNELNPEWCGFSESDMARGIKRAGEWLIRETDVEISKLQDAHDVAFGLMGSLYCCIGQLPCFTQDTIDTLRHVMNPLSREYHQDEDDWTDPMDYPERWKRYV